MTIQVVSYGGGLDSTAMLCGMIEKGLPPPYLILFADTGGEKPETYAYRESFSLFLTQNGYPTVETVRRNRRDGLWEILEQNCRRLNMLPSLAYGWKSCSLKYKVEPQKKRCNDDPVLRREWKAGRKVEKLIGFHYGEAHRARFTEDKKYVWLYPLLDWRWKKDEAASAIRRMGLSPPPKSACFFCPASTKTEILRLATVHPDLMERALQMEENAKLRTVKGLGRRLNWQQFLINWNTGAENPDHWPVDTPCECFDGGAVEAPR